MVPAIGLFLLSPLFGEFLLGNLSASDLPLLPFLAPLYGAGALLIRETARRFGRGSTTLLLLGVAYALVEEGLVDQMLFNHDYYDGQAAESDTIIGPLGVDAWLLLVVGTMHTIWSTYIPITIMEALSGERARRPWLGPVGYTVTAVTFVVGSVWLGWEIYRENDFFASPWQLAAAAAAVVALIAIALRVPQQHTDDAPAAGGVPRPGLLVGFALLTSSLFMFTEALPGWFEVLAALALIGVFTALARRWSGRSGFRERHRLALVAGGVLTYAWLGLTMEPETGPRASADQIGQVLIAAFAITLVIAAFRALRRHTRARATVR